MRGAGREGSRGCGQANPGESRSCPKSRWLLDADKMQGTPQVSGKAAWHVVLMLFPTPQPQLPASQAGEKQTCEHLQRRRTLQPARTPVCSFCKVWEGFKRCLSLSRLSHPASHGGFALFLSSSQCCFNCKRSQRAGDRGAGRFVFSEKDILQSPQGWWRWGIPPLLPQSTSSASSRGRAVPSGRSLGTCSGPGLCPASLRTQQLSQRPRWDRPRGDAHWR